MATIYKNHRHMYTGEEPKGTSRPGYLRPHHGAPWDEEQEGKLIRDFYTGYSLPDLANRMGRTNLATIARLEKLGIDPCDRSKTKTVAPLRTPQPIKEPTMNKILLLTLLQEGYTTAHVCFDNKYQGQTYIYKVPNSMKVSAGDMLVVPARDTFSVVWVKSVDASPKIDTKAPFNLKWAVQKIDATAYSDQLEREARAVKQIEDEQRLAAQREAADQLLGAGADVKAFQKLVNPR